LTPELGQLRERIRRCLAFYFHRPESYSRICPWEVMHCVAGFGVDTPLRAGDEDRNAVAWLCENLPCRGLRMLYVDDDRLGVRMGPGYQGHPGQFLAILAQSRVKIDYPIVVDDHDLTVADLVEYEQRTCKPGTELSFKLIGLSYYLDTEATWESQDGQTWDIPRLIREELAQPVVGACCGGTHRMTGFSYAVRKREQSGKPVTGQWHRAKKYVDDFHDYTLDLQNADGSFSTDWFRGREDYGGIDRKVTTTGHTLEWLVSSLPEDELTDPRVVKAVDFLTEVLWENRRHAWNIGPLGHSLRALALYDEHLFGGQPGQRADQLADYRTDDPWPRASTTRLTHSPAAAPPSGRAARPSTSRVFRRYGSWRRRAR
jgi:hypothetical protein